MTTNDLQRIDELVHSADMAVRVASQLRLWLKRRSVSDKEAIAEGNRFIVEAVQGGKFVATGEVASAASSLSPLTWSADIRFGFDRPMLSNQSKPQRYEELLQDLARLRKCDGIICGHIHTPEDKHVGDIHYLNSGDWVESLTAIIEHNDGRMELIQYEKFLNSLQATVRAAEVPEPVTAPH